MKEAVFKVRAGYIEGLYSQYILGFAELPYAQMALPVPQSGCLNGAL